MTSFRRRLVFIFVSTALVFSALLLSLTQLDPSHPLSSEALKQHLPLGVLLPPPPIPPLTEDLEEDEYLPPPSLLHNATHWLEPAAKNATDPYGMTLERLMSEFPTGPPDDEGAAHPFEAINRKNYHRIKTCLAERSTSVFQDEEDEDQLEAEGGVVDCPDSVFSVALLFTNFYAYHPGTRGEDIQCTSVIESLTSLDYTFFILPGWKHDDSLLRYYSVFQKLIKIIIIEDTILYACLSSEKCIQSPSYPTGPPLSIFLTSSWWGYRPEMAAGHPLGNQWVMTPYKIPDHGFLGYSIERGCTKQPLIPSEKRENTAVILAKETSYFHGGNGSPGRSAYPHPLYALAATLSSLTFLLFAPAPADSSSSPLPASLKPLGHLLPADYSLRLSKSRALVGIGFPGSSPSPYFALCFGVPFINPMLEGWEEAGGTRTDWWMNNNIFEWQGVQHGPLSLVGEPYVYTISTTHSSTANLTANPLVPALLKAKSTPIGRFIPEEMKETAMFARVKTIMEKDWRGEGKKMVKELVTGEGEGESSVIEAWLAAVAKQRAEKELKGKGGGSGAT